MHATYYRQQWCSMVKMVEEWEKEERQPPFSEGQMKEFLIHFINCCHRALQEIYEREENYVTACEEVGLYSANYFFLLLLRVTHDILDEETILSTLEQAIHGHPWEVQWQME